MTERGKNLLLLVATVVLTLLVCEVALRLWHGVSPLDFSNLRNRPSRPFALIVLTSLMPVTLLGRDSAGEKYRVIVDTSDIVAPSSDDT